MNLAFFNSQTNSVREKARIKLDPLSKLTIATLLCDSDVNMYLLAVSSFSRFVSAKEIIIVSDRLSDENCAVLRECIEGLTIIPAETCREPELPIGGCWERLTCILKQVPDSYVMQLDADTLTLKRPDELIDAIEKQLSFSITTKIGFEKMSFVSASYLVWERKSKHIQNEAEKAFKDCKDAESRLYVRACAAFTGFAKNAFSLDQVKAFSQELEDKLGKEKWAEWGSEQVASNYAFANSKDSQILPYEFYPFYEPGIDVSHKKVLHFIGTHRFKKGQYLKLAKEVINSL